MQRRTWLCPSHGGIASTLLLLAGLLAGLLTSTAGHAQDIQPVAGAQAAPAGQWTQFAAADGLPENSITALHMTDGGTIWVGTTFGVAVRSPAGAWTSFTDPESLNGAPVAAIAADPGAPNRLWFATGMGAALLDAGADVLDHSDDQWLTFAKPDGLTEETLSAVLVAPNDEVWFGTGAYAPIQGNGGSGLSVLDHHGTPFDKTDDTWRAYSMANSGLSNDQIRGLLRDSQGTIWIATASGLNAYSNGLWTSYYQEDGLPSNDIRALTVADGLLWLATGNGVAVLAPNDTPHDKSDDTSAIFTAVTTNYGLGENRTSSIAVDTAGLVWIGTDFLDDYGENGGGFYGLDPKQTPFDLSDDRWAAFRSTWSPTGEALLSRAVRIVAPGPDNTVWVGTPYGVSVLKYGLSPFDGGSDEWDAYLSSQHLQGNTVFATAEEPGARLWFGTDSGLSHLSYAYTPQAKADDRWRQLPWGVGAGRAVAVDAHNWLWVGTTDGLYIFDLGVSVEAYEDDKVIHYDTSTGLTHNRVNALAIDAAGRGWLATGDYYGGALQVLDPGQQVDKIDDDRWATFTGQNSPLPGAYVSALALAANQVWIGTNGGAAMLDVGPSPFEKTDDLWSVFRPDNSGLQDNMVRAVAVDGSGAAWFGLANSGLDVYTPAGAWQHFSRADGLAADTVTALRANRQGTLWIGTEGAGISVLDARDTPTDKTDDRWTTYAGPAVLPSGYVRTIGEDAFGQMWVGTFGGGVSVYSDVEFTRSLMPIVLWGNTAAAALPAPPEVWPTPIAVPVTPAP